MRQQIDVVSDYFAVTCAYYSSHYTDIFVYMNNICPPAFSTCQLLYSHPLLCSSSSWLEEVLSLLRPQARRSACLLVEELLQQ